MVDLEVSRVDNGSDGRFDRQRVGVDDGVGHVHPFDFEIPEGILFALDDVIEVFGIGREAVFVELVFDHGQHKRRTINWELQLFKKIGYRSNVVFVTVGDNDPLDLVFDDVEVAEVGDEDVHAVHRLIGETHSYINDDRRVFALEYGDVAADLTQPSERGEAEFPLEVRVKLTPGVHPGILHLIVFDESRSHFGGDVGRDLFAAPASAVAAAGGASTAGFFVAVLFVAILTVSVGTCVAVVAPFSLLRVAVIRTAIRTASVAVGIVVALTRGTLLPLRSMGIGIGRIAALLCRAVLAVGIGIAPSPFLFSGLAVGAGLILVVFFHR